MNPLVVRMKKLSVAIWGWVPVAVLCLLGLELGIVLQLRGTGSMFPCHLATPSRLSGIRLAIADFDGDWKPDIAVVETASLRRMQANYAIHVQLSGGTDSSFLISGPGGGVRVSARDVNGDSYPDVVISSVSDERVVAVLLNDGHGKFSRAEPASYLGTATDPGLFLHNFVVSLCDQLSVTSFRYSFDGEDANGTGGSVAFVPEPVVATETPAAHMVAMRASRGRSPPNADILS
jgi:hypothetical protein